MSKIVIKPLCIFLLYMAAGCTQERPSDPAPGPPGPARPGAAPQITFVELGSVNCIPCRKMQPVMAAVERKFGDQVKVIFYDVWQADQRHYAQQYDIRLIPTQVFLDVSGTEILRHEGFFPEAEISRFLQSQGLTDLTREGP